MNNIIKKHGFTLIELLVVVAIIAVLISILLPSLSRAKATAKAVVCQSKLKQIALAYEFYCQENNSVGPIGFSYGNHGARPGWGLPNPNPYGSYAGWYTNKKWALGSYLARAGNRPSEEGGVAKSTVACPNIPVGWDVHSAGYAVNGWLGYDTYLGRNVSMPESSPMLACPIYLDPATGLMCFTYVVHPDNLFGWWPTGNIFLSQVRINHPDATNSLFFDGHVAQMPYLGTTSAYKNKYTWYGGSERK